MDDKAIRTIPFDGKTSSYMVWSRKFMSLCSVKGCLDAILKDYDDEWIVADDATLDSNDDDDATKLQIIKENRMAYSMLMLSQNDNVTLRTLTSAVTEERPNGCARTAWLNLERIHKPLDDVTKYELVNKFNRL